MSHRFFILITILFISFLFLFMIKSFMIVLLLSALFSALIHPFYNRICRGIGGRKIWTAVITMSGVILILLIPLIGLMGIITTQAVKVGQSITPWVNQQLSSPSYFFEWLRNNVPFYDLILPYRETILYKLEALSGTLGGFLIDWLQAATVSGVTFIFLFFVFIYSMFFFLVDGEQMLQKIIGAIPLEKQETRRLLDKFTSVTRATVKGTMIIGIIQGGAAGIAFALAGIPAAAFWGAVMAILSFFPGIGSALIWIPGSIWLAEQGMWIKSLCLAAFCAAIVGSVDNLLRPILVGKDTKLSELLVFISTLGGISLFGLAGFIIGPIIAALFITVWEMQNSVVNEKTTPDAILDLHGGNRSTFFYRGDNDSKNKAY